MADINLTRVDSGASDAIPLPFIPVSDDEEEELPLVFDGDTSEEEVEAAEEESSSEEMFARTQEHGDVYIDVKKAMRDHTAANKKRDPSRLPKSHTFTHAAFSTTMFDPSTHQGVRRRISVRPNAHMIAGMQINPTYDISYMTSNPLVWTELKNSIRTRKPIKVQLNIDEEKSQLIDCCMKAIDGKDRTLKFVHRIATNGNLTQLMVQRTKVLHYSGHGIKGKLAFENEAETGSLGECNLIDKDILKGLFQKGDVKFVFVSACHSEKVGDMFVNAGVPHVIAILSSEQVDDQAANVFTKFFYMALLAGKTIQRSHELGKANVMAMPGQASFDADKFLLLPSSDDDKYHDVTMFNATKVPNPEGFVDLTTPVAKNKLVVNEEKFFGRAMDVAHIVQTVIKQRLTIIVGGKGHGKSSVIKAASNYLLERYLFNGGMYYFEFRPEHDEPASYTLDKYFAENLVDYDIIDHSKGAAPVGKQVQQWIRSQLNNVTSVFQGMLLCLDNLEFLVMDTLEYPFITDDIRRKNLRFLREILSKSRGLRILTSSFSRDLETLLYQKIQAVNPVARMIKPLEDRDAYEFFIKSSGMEPFADYRPEVMKILNRLECVPQRIRDFILEVKRTPGDVARDKALLSSVYKKVAVFKDEHGPKFWSEYMGDAELASVESILNNLDRFIKDVCKTRDRGLFWVEGSRQDEQANRAARTELYLWFASLPSVTKDQFGALWNARLHALIPTIIHLGDLWTTKGAVMGFWDKQQCTRIIQSSSLQTFLIRFPRTFAHHVSIVMNSPNGVVHLLVAIRSNSKTLPIANQNLYYQTDLPRFQKFVKKTEDLVNIWDCYEQREFHKKQHFEKRTSAKPPNPLYSCCADPQPGTTPQSNTVNLLLPARNSNQPGFRNNASYRR